MIHNVDANEVTLSAALALFGDFHKLLRLIARPTLEVWYKIC